MPHTLVLFYSPGACSLAVHAALEHIGAPYTPVEVDLRKKAQLDPQYLAMNPQGRVPTLGLDGQPVTEVTAIADTLDRLFPQAGLFAADPLARARQMAAVSRLSSDIHPLYRALWIPSWFADDPVLHEALKAKAAERLRAFYGELDQRLGAGTWGDGEPSGFLAFYTTVFLRWSAAVAPQGLGPACEALRARMAAHPAMAAAVAREGIRLDSLKRLSDD